MSSHFNSRAQSACDIPAPAELRPLRSDGTEVRSLAPPLILHGCAEVVCVGLALPSASEGIALRLEGSHVKRPQEFAAGRHCAAGALRAAGAAAWNQTIGTGAMGEPLWPSGYTGSITHISGFAAAAAASRKVTLGIGLDSEHIVGPVGATKVSPLVLHACETRLRAPALGRSALFTLVLSAKHALFKCLYPLVHVRFDYRDAAVRLIDVREGLLAVELLTTLPGGYSRGRTFTVQFVIHDRMVTTACCVTRDSHPAGN